MKLLKGGNTMEAEKAKKAERAKLLKRERAKRS